MADDRIVMLVNDFISKAYPSECILITQSGREIHCQLPHSVSLNGLRGRKLLSITHLLPVEFNPADQWIFRCDDRELWIATSHGITTVDLIFPEPQEPAE